MEISLLVNAVSSVRLNKLGSVLAICTLAMGLLLSASATHAATVERDGDNVRAIRQLTVGGSIYDVEFCSQSTPATYGEPPVWDFNRSDSAEAAAQAVIAELNAAGGVHTVGNPNCPGNPPVGPIFRVGFAVRAVDVPVLDTDVRLTSIWEGATDDVLNATSEVWKVPTDPDVFPYLDDGVWADFIFITSTGTGELPPVAEAGGPYAGAAGFAVSFDSAGSNDPDGSIVSYDWDFGDGSPHGTGATPSHTYAAANLYNVSLTVTDNNGLTDSDSSTADIGTESQPPDAVAGGPYEGTVGVPVSFDGSASDDPDSVIVDWDWAFGNGEFGGGETTTYTYVESGRYIVRLMVTDDTGATGNDFTTATISSESNLSPIADAGAPSTGVVGEVVNFDGSASVDPDGTVVTYDWDFGDGDTGTGATTSHTYSEADIYIVTLTVTDDGGVTDSNITAASIDASNQRPVANANGPYTGAANVAVSFDSTGSNDPDGTIAAYDWDFGDGSPHGTGAAPSHSYAAGGNYNVILTVTDNDGVPAEDLTTADIDSPNKSPHADSGGPGYAGVVGVPVPFDGTGSYDTDGYLVSMAWEFADGTDNGTGETPEHTYTAPGIYNVILTVTDNDDATSGNGSLVFIGEGNMPPVADPGGPYTGVVGVPVSFNGSESSDPEGDILSYEWDFGDGNTGTGAKPSHTYDSADIWTVYLTVTDGSNLSDEDYAQADIRVESQPPAAIAGVPYRGTVGRAVVFDASGSKDPDGIIVEFKWDFGDGDSGTGENITHAYAASGKYNVILTVKDDSGSSGSFTAVALVLDPSINYPPDKPSLMDPTNGAIVDLGGTDAYTLRWSPSSDPNDDLVSYEVYLCTDTDPVANCAARQVVYFNSLGDGNVIYASVAPVNISKSMDLQTMALMGVLVCLVLIGLSWKARKQILVWLLMVLSFAILASCSDSGGGGSSRSAVAPADEVTYLATGLAPDTTYYWAVVAKDGQGGETASDTWTFTTE
jgi:PKD repeat protein